MRFAVDQKDLAVTVAWTHKSVPQRATVPVLAGIKIEVADDVASFSGFDFERASVARLGTAPGAEDGAALVPGRLLAEIARALPAGRQVTLETKGQRISVTAGSAKFELPTMPLADYPSLPTVPPTIGHVDAKVLARVVSKVARSAGRDDTLPVLTGVRVEIDPGTGTVTLATTDRYRLGVCSFSFAPADTAVAPSNILVPVRVLADLAASLADDGGTVALCAGSGAQGEGIFGVETSARTATARLLDGDFPNYRALLPTEDKFTSRTVVDREALAETVKRVSLVNATRTSPLRFTVSDGLLHVEAGAGDDASAGDDVEVEHTGEEGATIAFNPAFLIEGLDAFVTDKVSLNMQSTTRPATVTACPADPEEKNEKAVAAAVEDAGFVYLVMPVRLPS